MPDHEKNRDSSDLQTIEQGETYEHSRHGSIEVTGIFRGISKVDEARNTDEQETIIVRYAPTDSTGPESDIGLVDTLDEFLEATR